MNKLRILHLNDLHSHLERFPVIERFFAEKSHEEVESLSFDLGDNVDRVHPLTEATEGQFNVELMNRLDLTAATIGNNEGLGLTHEMLSHLYDEANFPVLLSNLATNFAQSEPLIVTTSFGLRIGLIGLTAPYVLAYPQAGWELSDPFVVLDELLPKLDCDFTILLSHLGKNVDEQIAKDYDEIDLIIGAHTHHLFEHGAQVNQTLLAAAGRYGEYVGQIDLTFNENNQLVDAQIEAIATNTLPQRKSDLVETNGWELRGHKLLEGTVVADLSRILLQWLGDGGQRDYKQLEGKGVWLYNVNTKKKQKVGTVKFWQPASAAAKEAGGKSLIGTDVWNIDFSANKPGCYRLVVEDVGCSMDFEVKNDIYYEPYRYSVRGYYYMRLGEPINTDKVFPAPRQPQFIPETDPKGFTV